MKIGKFVLGDPLKTDNIAAQKLNKGRALAIFASDVLSSVAYATESILITLTVVYATEWSLPIAGAIIMLLFALISSYWQTIKEYPNGGGAFAVAHKNLGEVCGLIAAASLLIAYALTVAVSLSAGARAITSACPSLSNWNMAICWIGLSAITITNLRGTRESATLLSIPTYCFIGILLALIVSGFFVPVSENPISDNMIAQTVAPLLLMRAFASGCSALTGIEAIASGVTAFQNPQYRNARITLLLMGIILSTLFGGITFLAKKFSILPSNTETVLSQIAHQVFGDGIAYYGLQFMTACILFLAANTSFAGFPRLASVLAQEKYIPTSFANLGDRLAFSNGIIALAVVAFFLLYMFGSSTQGLLPIYALCVFISFTLSQAGMVCHLIREKKEYWVLKAIISAAGATATAVTMLIIVEWQFFKTIWILLILIPSLFYAFRTINHRYKATNTELDLKKGGLSDLLRPIKDLPPKVVVPVSRIHRGTLAALRFAKSLSNDVAAVVVKTDQLEVNRLKLTWRAMSFDIPLVILDSPYRSVVNPFLDFLYEQDEREPDRGKAIVVMPSFVPGRFWQNILHNQTARIFKTALLYRRRKSEQTRIIVEIPYQMKM